MPLRLIDRTPLVDKEGKLSAITRLQATRKYGSDWPAEVAAQKIIISRLERVFSDRFILFRNLSLPEMDFPIPLIMIGPSGIRVMYVSPTSGLFEARGEEWLAYNEKTETYEPAQPDLIQRTLLFSDDVERYLEDNDINTTLLKPALLFTNPGIDVETEDPAVRVVRFDALQRFVQSMLVEEITLDIDEITRITETLKEASEEAEQAEEEINFSLADFKLPNFSRSQWIIILLLVSVNIIIIFVVLALFLSRIF